MSTSPSALASCGGFEPDRPAHRKERALCRRFARISERCENYPRHRGPRTCASIDASSCKGATTRRNGIWSARQRIHPAARPPGRWRREISSAVSAFTYQEPRRRPAALHLLRCADRGVESSSGFLPIGRRRKSSCVTVYPTRRFLPSKLQVFLEDLKAWKSPLWIPLR